MYYLHSYHMTGSVANDSKGLVPHHTSRDYALGSALSALESHKTLIMRPVTMCP